MAITGQDLLKRLKQNNTNKSTITGSDLLAAKKYGANSVNNDYISSYIKDTESYINNAKKQYEGVGWGNASEVYNAQSSTYDDLEKRRKTINSWLKLNQNKVANYDSLAKSLADLEKSTADVVGSFKSAKDYYSQWDTQEAYDAYKKTEDEKKAILEAPDFKEYSQAGADIKNPTYAEATGSDNFLGWQNPFAQKAEIGNIVTFSRENADTIEKALAMANNNADAGTTAGDYRYRYMTDEEVSIYNYYLGKGDKERADAYLSSLSDSLEQRWGGKIADRMSANAFLEMTFAVNAGLDQFASGIGNIDNYLKGTEADPTTATQYASGMIREELGTFGKGAYDFINTTSNMLPSILAGSMTNIIAPGAGTYVGAGLIGLSATGNAYAEMRNLGYNENQARGYATLVGASESTLSALFGGIKGIGGKLTNHAVSKFISGIDNGFARVAIKYGSEMLSEGLEESVQSVLEPMFKRLTTGDEFDVDWGEVAYSGLLGALSAGVLNAAPTTFEIAQTMAAGKNIKANEGVERLKNLGTAMSADSAAYKIANKIDENTGAYKIGLLLNEVGATLSEQNMSDIRTSLERKGVASKDAATIAKWMQKAVNGEYFTARQRAALENNDTLAQTLVDVVINPKSTIAQREGEVASLRELAQTKATPTKAEKSAPTAEEAPEVTENAPIKEKASEGKISASEPYAVLSSVTDNISEVIGKVGDKYKVRLNDGTELLEDAAEMSPNTERLFATAKDLGLNAESANVFLKSYDGSMSAADYATAYAEAYRYGEYNFAESEMRSDGFSALLSESQRKIAYESGRIDRKYKTEAKQAEIKKTDKKQSKGKLHNTFAPTNERQKASLKALGVLAEALGIDIYTFESETNAEGKHVGKNGWYDPKDNSIHIDVYAGAQGHDTVLFTAAHELTHMTRRWSPEKFKVFSDFLMEKYGEQGKSVSELVRAQMSKAEKNGRKLTFDEAYEELVADSCESFLADGDAIAKIAELKAKDKSLWEKIKDYLTKLIARIKAAYEGLEPDSEEGRFVASLLDSAEELRDLWVEAVVDASEAYNEGEIENDTDTEVKYSYSSIAYSFFGDKDISIADMESGAYKNTDGYKQYVDQCVNNMRQSIADFNEETATKEVRDSIDGIVKVAVAMKKAGYDILDSKGGRTVRDSKNRLLFSSLEPNSDYFTSSDISTICDKRINFADIYDEIVKREDALGVPSNKRFFNNIDNYFVLHKILADKGLTAPCRQCYVESMRKNLDPMANAFIELMQEKNPENKANKQLYQPSGKNKGELKSNNAKLRESLLETIEREEYDITVDDLTIKMLTTADGLAQLKLQAPLIYEAFNSFYGQSKPKMPKAATPFRFGELTALLTDDKGRIKKGLIDKIKSTGGFRLQSYSDFQIQNFADVLQVIFEAGTLGLNGHAYTKVPAFLDATKGTNLKRNISIFMYKDEGQWKIDRGDSFPLPLDDIYDIVNSDDSGNTGIIAVVQNEDMAAWIMANENIGYFIPFHKSGVKMGVVRETIVKEGGRAIKGYTDIKDHTRQQTEVWATTTADHKKNTKVKNGINIYSKDVGWDFDNTENLSQKDLIKKNVMAYIDACNQAGYLPKFREYVMDNGKVLNKVLAYAKELGFVSQDATIDDISFEYSGYRIPYGYYKCLGDFGMFTPDGEASPIERLSLKEYNFAEAEKFFSDAETLRRNEILQQFENGTEREKYRSGEFSHMTTAELAAEIQRRRNQIVDEVVGRNDQVKYSDRSSDTVSNRTLLAEALEGITLNDIEKKKLADYKANAEKLDAAEARLKEVRAEIKEISFSKGTRDKARLSALKEEATQLTNRINIYDRRLINLEATSALKGVLDRAKADVKAREKAKAKADLDAYKERSKAREKEIAEAYRESRAANVEGRRKTEMRHKILKTVHDLNKVLENPTKEKHIPIALQKPVAEALAAINMDTVTAEERLAKYDEAIAKAEAEGNTDKAEKLKKTRANIESQGHNLEDKLTRLNALYELLKTSKDPLIKNSYDENIAGLISEVQEKVGDTPIRKMNLAQLNLVYDMFKALKKTISDTNKMFLEAKAEKVSDNASNVVTEILSVAKMKDKEIVGSKPFKKYGWSLLKPTTAMELIGSDTFSSLFANVRAGEETWARDTNEAKTFFQETAKKHGYWKWNFEKKYGFVDKNNRRFELTLDQMLSLYAYSKRDQADLHLDLGGFVFDDNIEVIQKKHGIPFKYNIKTQKTYNLTKDELQTIIDELDDSQKAFVDEMQTFLSETMGDKGNEVSLAMYDIKLFKEKNYFPLKTARYYREFDPEKKGLPSFKNSGFTKKLTPGANNPVILSNFLDVWSNHVNEMSTYHAFVLPLEDFMRVFNYTERDGGYDSVRAKIVSAYGKAAAEYVENLMTDLNGGARSDYYTGLFSKTFTLFKKSATYLSASVTIQQPSSIARAFAYIDPKYFATDPKTANLSAEWEEMKKYAPVAIIKEMGSFDIGVGRQSAKWITARDYDGFKEKASALVKDADYRDDVLSILPATADKIAWVYIWEAAKKKAATEQNLDGEALLIAAGKIATEAIVNTQVYDSVLTRSGIMRSKGDFTKMLTAFMAEPITTLNMGINGFIQSRRGKPKLAAKMFASVAVANVLNSILVSIVKAARDDDEDQTYGEKYLESLTGEVLDGTNILTYLPYIKDAWSLLQGYSVDRPDMTLLDRLVDGITALSNDNKTWGEKARRLAEDLSALFGIPVKNVLRDIDALFNVTKGIIDPPEETDGAGEAMLEGLRSASPKGWYKAKKEEKKNPLIQACEDEDFTTAKALIRDEIANAKEDGKTESEAKSALRSRMTSYYKPLYIEANEARDAAEMARIRKILARSGLYGKADDVIATTKNWLKK